MNEDQKKAYEDRLNLLPQVYQEVIRSYPWEERVISIGNDKKLYLDQVDGLLAEVALVLVGLTGADDFRSELLSHMIVEDDKVDELIQALNVQIFNPITDTIQKRTSEVQPQFESAPKNTQAASTATGVFKIAPESYSTSEAHPQDPYHEPID